ncbi:MAG: prepilin-type processing-associated H-X9-DG protein [Phycisphaerales bacterium]|jgi:prepilin-type processing-associated H-X9-DG protein
MLTHPAGALHARRGFTIIELIFLILVVAVLMIWLLLPAISVRGDTRNIVSQANLRSLGAMYANYAEDNDDWIATLPPDPAKAREDVIRILAKQTGRGIEDGSAGQLLRLESPILPSIRYQSLPLMEYITAQLPEYILASPYDRKLQEWQDDPVFAVQDGHVPFVAGKSDQFPELATPDVQQLWPYGSSYQMVAAAWNPNDNSGPTKSWLPRLDTPHQFDRSSDAEAPHGQRRRYAEVVFPSGKVMMYEEFDWTTKNGPRWNTADGASVNVAFFDGSVRYLKAADFNPGASPETSGSDPFVQRFQTFGNYPAGVPARHQAGDSPLRFRWTRAGLGGIDIGGREVRTND